MIDDDSVLHPTPAQAPLDGMTASARVRQTGKGWEVVVVFSRPPGQPPMAAADVQVQLYAGDAEPMDLLQAPRGPWLAEIGGGLGATVNARFEFGARAVQPVRLIVRYRTDELSFQLAPRAG